VLQHFVSVPVVFSLPALSLSSQLLRLLFITTSGEAEKIRKEQEERKQQELKQNVATLPGK